MERCFWIVVVIIVPLASFGLGAQNVDLARSMIGEGAYKAALEELLENKRDLAPVLPVLAPVRGNERARFFTEIARCHYGLENDDQARNLLEYAYHLDPELLSGHDGETDATLEAAISYLDGLRRASIVSKYAATTLKGAVGRSLLLPGWGQIRRGHKKKGFVAMTAAAVAGSYFVVSYSSYISAKGAYESIRRYNLPVVDSRRDVSSFNERFEAYDRETKKLNVAAAIVVAVWGATLTDNLVSGPRSLAIQVPLRLGKGKR